MAELKTNAMRMVEAHGIPYTVHGYEPGEAVDGVTAAQKIGKPPEQVYKTLVTKGKDDYYVFVIPVAEELNLKNAAKSVGEKSVEMIRVKDLNKVTGYIRGGCSPIGMKKQFRTVIEETAILLETFVVSAGKIGRQIELSPEALAIMLKADFAPLIL